MVVAVGGGSLLLQLLLIVQIRVREVAPGERSGINAKISLGLVGPLDLFVRRN